VQFVQQAAGQATTAPGGHRSALEAVTISGESVVLTFLDGATITVASTWLREVCRCRDCRFEETGRRRVEALSSPRDLVPSGVAVGLGGHTVIVDWSDGHRGEVAVEDVYLGLSATVSRAARSPGCHVPERATPWGVELAGQIPFARYGEVVEDEGVELEWLRAIDEVGFAVMQGVPRTREAMIRLAESVGPVRASNYGLDWEIEAVVEPDNAVVSTAGLTPHTDLPYRQLPPGLQFLLCDVQDAPGGASTLVDGFRIAEELRTTEPHHWHVLTEVALPYRFADNTLDLEWLAPVIGLRADGCYGVFRHAPGLLGPLDPTPSVFRPLHAALQRFTELTNDPAFQVAHRLEPGELLAFDNHRLLHGRRPFDLAAGGRRHLLGNYLDRDDLASRIRVLDRLTSGRRRPATGERRS
jgi:gamma-butyrobetaine dioxygenase